MVSYRFVSIDNLTIILLLDYNNSTNYYIRFGIHLILCPFQCSTHAQKSLESSKPTMTIIILLIIMHVQFIMVSEKNELKFMHVAL